ncbi:MAG: catalase family peroxidase [Solirubrobacteraceae bacterium]
MPGTAATPTAATPTAATPQDALDAADYAYGTHPGHRALHAKGTVLTGTFTASGEAAGLSRAVHMQGGTYPVTARVSNGSGNPGDPDAAPGVRGLAVKFQLPDGSRTDILAQTIERLPAHNPGQFLQLILTERRTATAWRMPLFVAQHPSAARAMPKVLYGLVPPLSYATCNYFAIHAFRFIDANGDSRYVRYTFVPEAGVRHLRPWEMVRRDPDYLQQEIRARLEREPVRFRLELQVAADGDPVDDLAVAWPKDRRRVTAGTLELTGLDTEREQGGNVLAFDPTRLTDGIELSGDSVLRFRPAVYSESVGRRTT